MFAVPSLDLGKCEFSQIRRGFGKHAELWADISLNLIDSSPNITLSVYCTLLGSGKMLPDQYPEEQFLRQKCRIRRINNSKKI